VAIEDYFGNTTEKRGTICNRTIHLRPLEAEKKAEKRRRVTDLEG